MKATEERFIKIIIIFLSLQLMDWYSSIENNIFDLIFYLYSILITIPILNFTIKDFKIFYKGIKTKSFFEYKPLIVDIILLVFNFGLLSYTFKGIFKC